MHVIGAVLMIKNISAIVSGILTTFFLSGLLQAAELELSSLNRMGGNLSDGTRIATGQILCRDSHSGFHVWMNAQKAGYQPEHYIIRGQLNSQNEIRVRLTGDRWSPSVDKGQNGVIRISADERAIFDILVDGRQNVEADRYILSLHGVCL
ncbi:AfaD family invasin [Escherichia coli]|uniref:AfaD family invasin n=1 Tax=Escherichia coli TaxID=562 RepID=UPI0037BF177F